MPRCRQGPAAPCSPCRRFSPKTVPGGKGKSGRRVTAPAVFFCAIYQDSHIISMHSEHSLRLSSLPTAFPDAGRPSWGSTARTHPGAPRKGPEQGTFGGGNGITLRAGSARGTACRRDPAVPDPSLQAARGGATDFVGLSIVV